MPTKISLNNLYTLLLCYYGAQHWWPISCGTRKKSERGLSGAQLEIMLGAILTQNTAWKNVELALANLSGARLLDWHKLQNTPKRSLARCVKPAGYYNQKAGYIKNLVKKILKEPWQENDSLERLRRYFLAIKGIGEETADSILLYALGKPSFVVDAYTKRLFSRLGLIPGKATYAAIQDFVRKDLTLRGNKVKLYQEFHALIVKHIKEFCHPKPKCEKCVLKRQCNYH
ncbi:MAG: endonuclease [Patescibacteria group bacterium]|nr:endonuclease [Patescibacteria group bacterium]